MDQVDFRPDLPGEHSDEEHALLAEHIVAYRIDGPLFFMAPTASCWSCPRSPTYGW